jgi:hypothetical protein
LLIILSINPEIKTSGSYHNCLDFFKELLFFFHSGCTILYSYQQYMKVTNDLLQVWWLTLIVCYLGGRGRRIMSSRPAQKILVRPLIEAKQSQTKPTKPRAGSQA